MQTNKEVKITVQVVIDDVCYPDYYKGHGHTFSPDNLIACIPFSVSVNYSETIGDVIDMILEDINSRLEPIEAVNEKLFEQYEDTIASIDLREILEKQLVKEGETLESPFFNIDKIYEIFGSKEEYEEWKKSLEDIGLAGEYPHIFGYIHFYLEDDNDE